MKILLKYISFLILLYPFTAKATCSKEDIGKINEYLTKLDSYAIKFYQISEKSSSTGAIIIKKPSFRINYDPPHPLLITFGSNFISIYDYDLDQITRTKNKDNIFRTLFSKEALFDNSVSIDSCTKTEDLFIIDIRHKETENMANLEFNKDPIKISKITIPSDGLNYDKGVVEVIITDFIRVNNTKKEFFTIKDPEIFEKPLRYKVDEIISLMK